MEYLKEYDFTDDDINELKEILDDNDINEIILEETLIKNMLDYLKNIGIKSVKDVLFMKPYIIYSSINAIDRAINNYDGDIINLINEDIRNIELLDI